MRPTLTGLGDVRFDGPADFLEEYDRNIRSGGMEVQTELVLAVRQPVLLTVHMPSGDAPVALSAEVLYANAGVAALQLEANPEAARRFAAEAMTLITGQPPTGTYPTADTAKPAPAPTHQTFLYRAAVARTPPATTRDNLEHSPGLTPPPVADLERAAAQAATVQSFKGRIARAFSLDDLVDAVGIAPPTESPASSTTILQLLRTLAHNQATGTLRVHTSGQTRALHLLAGTVISARSDPPRESEQVGRLLVDLGRMNERQKVDAVERAQKSQRRVGSVLVEMGVIRTDQLEALLRFQVEVRTLDLFSWSEGDFEFTSGHDAAMEAEAHPIKLKPLFVKQAHRFLRMSSLADLTDYLGGDFHRRVRVAGGTPALEPYVPDLKQSRALAPLLDGTRATRDVAAACTLGRVATLRLLVLLRAAGISEFTSTASVPAMVREQGSPLRDRIAQLTRQNFFERLGIHFSAHAKEIVPAFRKMVHQLDEVTGDDPALKPRIRELLDEAMRTLVDPPARKRYRHHIVGDDRIQMAAELLLKQAQLSSLKGEVERALEMLDVVDEIQPSDSAVALRRRIMASSNV